MTSLAIFLATILSFLLPSLAAAQAPDDRDGVGTLREFVIHYLDRHPNRRFPRDPATTVAIAKTSLGPEDPDGFVIYIHSFGCRGSGGCPMLFVTRVDNRFEPLGFVCCIDLPVSVRRYQGASSPEFVVTERGFEGMGSNEHSVVYRVTLSRRGDTYDVNQPRTTLDPERPPADLINEDAAMVPLY